MSKKKLVYGGDIKDFPQEVVEKMLERQVEQGNKRDISFFELDNSISKEDDGFNWDKTIEGFEFWGQVISKKNFHLFFEKYPKKSTKRDSKGKFVSQTKKPASDIKTPAKKVYISGKISGLSKEDYTQNFENSKNDIEWLGLTAVSPLDYVSEDLSWIDQMIECLSLIKTCDAVLMQPNWEDSEGARIEYQIAKRLGLVIWFESGFSGYGQCKCK